MAIQLQSNARARRRDDTERTLYTLKVTYGDFTGAPSVETFEPRSNLVMKG